jgi:hypothetical protein
MTDWHEVWKQNARARQVGVAETAGIGRRFGITSEAFRVLDGLTSWRDRRGKVYFLLPRRITAAQARRIVLLTYVLNAGTDYVLAADLRGVECPYVVGAAYSTDEVQRIIDRQAANAWSYRLLLPATQRCGGVVVATPNGILMAQGAAPPVGWLSQAGGTTYGDLFIINQDHPKTALADLQTLIESGVWGRLTLDRLLHHEELHSQQWAHNGFWRFATSYTGHQIIGHRGRTNPWEQQAGLSDGGY